MASDHDDWEIRSEGAVDHRLARHNEIVERELCPRCGGPWLEPGGISLDYNAKRRAFIEDTGSHEDYLGQRDPGDPPWEEWLAGEIGAPQGFLICRWCVEDEDGLPDEDDRREWYRDGGDRRDEDEGEQDDRRGWYRSDGRDEEDEEEEGLPDEDDRDDIGRHVEG